MNVLNLSYTIHRKKEIYHTVLDSLKKNVKVQRNVLIRWIFVFTSIICWRFIQCVRKQEQLGFRRKWSTFLFAFAMWNGSELSKSIFKTSLFFSGKLSRQMWSVEAKVFVSRFSRLLWQLTYRQYNVGNPYISMHKNFVHCRCHWVTIEFVMTRHVTLKFRTGRHTNCTKHNVLLYLL